MILIGTAQTAAADWPVARGSVQARGVAESSLPDKPPLLWKYPSPDTAFETEPVVADGVVYLGDADGTLHAVRLATGEAVWTKTIEESGFAAAAAVEGDRLFIGDVFGVIRSFSISDGAERWRVETGSEVFAGVYLHEGALLVTTESGVLYALEAKTGAERWRFAIEAPLRCSPTVVTDEGIAHTLLAGCDAKLHAVDLATGKEIGAVEIGAQTGSTAAVAGGVAYLGAESGAFFAIDATKPASPAVAWTYRDPRRGQGIRTAAAVGESLVVYGSNGKAVYGVDRRTGQPVWTKPVRSRVESSPVIVGNRVVAATTRGRLLLLNLADGETVWEYDAGGGFVAAPALVDGRLLIANEDGTLYCFGRKE